MDWSFVHETWEKWAPVGVGSSGEPLKAALLINYDPNGPSRLLSTIAEQEGQKVNPIELSQFVDFIKQNNLQTQSFIIGPNQCMMAQLARHLVLCCLLINLYGSWVEDFFSLIFQNAWGSPFG
ncbi:uncharacterized protein LOC123222482 isoform X3 [Mangifera indica]|uniref:uncharacterized protein LOC123222482 isoform X3 n=1 Tax=Mangifera indica TaxID=29780 RepID=UPI001CFAA262|nr:uncharacterized protein LOC123222482 isoform X3 [Mangifera indica]